MPGCKALNGPATNPENSACRGRMERRAKCPHGKEIDWQIDWRNPIPHLPRFDQKVGQGLIVYVSDGETFNVQHRTLNLQISP